MTVYRCTADHIIRECDVWGRHDVAVCSCWVPESPGYCLAPVQLVQQAADLLMVAFTLGGTDAVRAYEEITYHEQAE